MSWFYAEGTAQKGPISEADFDQLVSQKVILPDTLVWREGMPEWKPLAEVSIAGSDGAIKVICSLCGNRFGADEVIQLEGQNVCAQCKPQALQRMKEGVASSESEAIRKAHLSHEASVKSIGVLYLLGGVFLMLGAAGMMVGAVAGPTAQEKGVSAGIAVLFLLMGGLYLWTGIGIRKLQRWTRIPVGILSGIGLLGFPVGTLINAYILHLVFSEKGKMVFSPEYQQIIEATPHIKYKNSILVWIILGLFLLFCGMGFFFAVRGK